MGRCIAAPLKSHNSIYTINEAAAKIRTTPAKINDIFRGRKTYSCRLHFDFREHPVRIWRRHWKPPLLDQTSVFHIGKYLSLKAKVADRKFFCISSLFTRYGRNMKLISDFAFSRAVLGEKCPNISILHASTHSGLHVHELNGTVYTSNSMEGKLFLFCARLCSWNRKIISMEFGKLREETEKYSAWDDFPEELQIKLWFLREYLNTPNLKDCLFTFTYLGMHKLLSTAPVERFFTMTFDQFF